MIKNYNNNKIRDQEVLVDKNPGKTGNRLYFQGTER